MIIGAIRRVGTAGRGCDMRWGRSLVSAFLVLALDHCYAIVTTWIGSHIHETMQILYLLSQGVRSLRHFPFSHTRVIMSSPLGDDIVTTQPSASFRSIESTVMSL